MVGLNESGHAYLFGTGAAFGNTYTTDQMIAAFHKHRAIAGDLEYDRKLVDRVFQGCRFDGHSIALPLEDLFRAFTRPEYLKVHVADIFSSIVPPSCCVWLKLPVA